MPTTSESAALSAAFSQIARRKTGTRYPKSLRARALAYTRARQTEGASLHKIAAEISLAPHTLRNWLSLPLSTIAPKPAESAPFQRVQLLPSHPQQPALTLRIHGPCGLVIDGLDLNTLADLLRRLSC